MNTRQMARTFHAVLLVGGIVAAAAGGCASGEAQRPSDDVLKTRVEAALANAEDVPGEEITVEVTDGVVTLSGKVPSDGQRGVPYPGATVQQSIGAVVRAVPGVEEVRFSIQIEPVSSAR
ncbi:MAG: BON domain-containing protein [Vicinamibacterales bacterium]|nr:BON domain-containing protein [Vicinamibacterales bacterium]HJN43527.1 BON domain-containing protein [Vicinamibacterales bacterium]